MGLEEGSSSPEPGNKSPQPLVILSESQVASSICSLQGETQVAASSWAPSTETGIGPVCLQPLFEVTGSKGYTVPIPVTSRVLRGPSGQEEPPCVM